MNWTISPKNLYVETLTLNVMVFAGGAFGRWLGLEEVVKIEPSDGISALIRNLRACAPSVLSLSLCLPYEDTMRKPQSNSQEGDPHHSLAMAASWSWTCSLQNCKKSNFCYLSHPVYGTFSN